METNLSNFTEIKCNESDHIFKISNVDKDYINMLNRKWYFWKSKKGKGPELVCSRQDNHTIYLRDVIMMQARNKQPGHKYSIHFKNNDPLDNRRENLEWVCKHERRKRKRDEKEINDLSYIISNI